VSSACASPFFPFSLFFRPFPFFLFLLATRRRPQWARTLNGSPFFFFPPLFFPNFFFFFPPFFFYGGRSALGRPIRIKQGIGRPRDFPFSFFFRGQFFFPILSSQALKESYDLEYGTEALGNSTSFFFFFFLVDFFLFFFFFKRDCFGGEDGTVLNS